MWNVKLQTDVIKGQWDERYKSCLFWEFHYILAQNEEEIYIYFKTFLDWEEANQLLDRILKAENFSPNPKYWMQIRDTRPLIPQKQDQRWMWIRITDRLTSIADKSEKVSVPSHAEDR